MPSPELSQTFALLSRLQRGDKGALGALAALDLPWVRARVESRLGAEDVVRETRVQVLRDGPKFRNSHQTHFRAWIAHEITNVLRAKHRSLHQKRRDVERVLPSSWILGHFAARVANSASMTDSLQSSPHGSVHLEGALEMLLAGTDRDQVLHDQPDKSSHRKSAASRA